MNSKEGKRGLNMRTVYGVCFVALLLGEQITPVQAGVFVEGNITLGNIIAKQ
jgi:hypothetical protein